MIDIENTVVSRDILNCFFVCNLSVCKGACCVQGDSGAPLDRDEVEMLEKVFPKIKPFLRKEGMEAICAQGTSVIDSENDTVTPLIKGKECAYAFFENGIARCAIEKAYYAGATVFRKPVSCHMYPVRIRKYKTFDAVNYDRWEICKPAVEHGEKLQMPLYRFSEEALIRKYGQEWFSRLEVAAQDAAMNFKEDQK